MQIPYYKLFLLFSLLTLIQCRNQPKQAEEDFFNIEVDTSGVFLQYRSTVFTIPSPHQVNLMLKQSDVSFKPGLINNAGNFTTYTTTIKKAINLGIYGADLGYLNIYEKSQESLTYYLVIEKLSKELELGDVIDDNTLKQIERNLNQNDSILRIISNTYKNIDRYLALNNREIIGALILAGGWLEAMYISTQLLLDNYYPEIIKQVSKHKYPLENLIRLLAPYYDHSRELQELIDALTDLAYEFDCIDILYTYQEPVTYPDKKLTIFQSESELNLNNYNLEKITNKIAIIRNKIVN